MVAIYAAKSGVLTLFLVRLAQKMRVAKPKK
jgi:hypothetical protein